MTDYGFTIPTMSEPERQRISEFIEKEFGITMPGNKKVLLESRLAKRLRACELDSYGAYFDFVTRDPRGRDEFLRFADLVSTHETSFFREPGHFEYLSRAALPTLVGRSRRSPLTVLSAACSTGEEAYTVAMILASGFRRHLGEAPNFSVEGVDLSHRAVAAAERGIYPEDRTQPIPPDLKRDYLMRSKSRDKLCRVVPELRRNTVFHTGNLLGEMSLNHRTYDMIFCRNVLIYFDAANRRRVLNTLMDRLKPSGLLFLGHSETMLPSDLPIRSMAHAVYQKV